MMEKKKTFEEFLFIFDFISYCHDNNLKCYHDTAFKFKMIKINYQQVFTWYST